MQIPHGLRGLLEPLPFPTRFSDDRIRISTVRLALLKRLWSYFPVGRLESRAALDSYQGGDLLDVGAFHGWYTVLLAPRAHAGDRLVSFEPDTTAVPVLRAILRDLSRHFRSLDLCVVTQPVGDGLPAAASWPAGDAGHPRFGRAAQGGALPSLTVDEYVAREGLRPRFVKIDVEGAEIFVLRGMRDTLAEHRPVLMLEIHPHWQPDGIDAADVESFIRDAGYHGNTFDDGQSSRRQIWRPQLVSDCGP